ncbi:50S ribosomal protein L6 [Candidatus Micrarchaeota archaeon]|nr:50S ribosomal protein L6 [Candidatus Micrarchaeota archaeon]
MAKKEVVVTVDVPDDVQITVNQEGRIVKVNASGEKGSLEKIYKIPNVTVNQKDKQIVLQGHVMFVNTLAAHLRNVIRGVREGYTIRMKALYSHFPMSITVNGNMIEIKNFVGRKDRVVAKIIGNTKVDVKGQEVIVSGVDKEAVGQTAANIRNATKIRGYDPRVFQDGIYYALEEE